MAPTKARAGPSSDFRTFRAVLNSSGIGQKPNLTSCSFRAFRFAKRCLVPRCLSLRGGPTGRYGNPHPRPQRFLCKGNCHGGAVFPQGSLGPCGERGFGRPHRAAPTRGWRFAEINGAVRCGSLAAGRRGHRPLQRGTEVPARPMYLRHGFRRPNSGMESGASVMGIGPYGRDEGYRLPRRPVGPPRNDNYFLSFRGAKRRGNPFLSWRSPGLARFMGGIADPGTIAAEAAPRPGGPQTLPIEARTRPGTPVLRPSVPGKVQEGAKAPSWFPPPAERIESIFPGGMYGGKNTSHEAKCRRHRRRHPSGVPSPSPRHSRGGAVPPKWPFWRLPSRNDV